MSATRTPTQTKQFSDFSGGINRTAARTRMRDNQLYFCDNAQPIGPGQLQTLAPAGASIATIAAGIASLWGVTLLIAGAETPLLLTVNNDGSMSQINPVTLAVTTIAAAGTVTTKARLTPWDDTLILIVDPTKGYFSWNGTTFATLSGTTVARDVAAFERRAWLLTGTRTISFTAPDSTSDFTTANGGGTTTVRDSIFVDQITRLLSALELLWLVGPAAVNSISNVQATGSAPVVTTFANTNIVANVGSALASSVAAFFRTFLFLTPYGIYAIVGATPQKLSDDLDGLFPSLVLGTDAPAAVFTVNNVFVWAVLVTYADPKLGNRPVLLCFARGAWFLASQGTVTWITALIQGGVPTLWLTDGSHIFKAFAGTGTASYTISTKLWDFGSLTQRTQLLRIALEFTTTDLVTATVTLENESGNAQVAAPVTPLSTLTFTGLGGAPITFVGAGAITWISSGLQLARAAVDFAGNYLGLTISGSSKPFALSALAMELAPMGEWTGPTA